MALSDNSWWCWFVLAGAFYISFTVDGYNFAFGILKLHIEKEYHGSVSKEAVALIGALVPTLYCLLAPLAFALVAVFSVRTLTICGALLSTVGFLITFANSYLEWGFALDLISLGVIQGVAAAMLYGPSINMIPTYFRADRKALSTGITTSGSPAGAIAYGFLMHELIDHFGWRRSMLFWAIFSGFIVFAGITFVPKSGKKAESKSKKEKILQQIEIGINMNDEASKTDVPSVPSLQPLLPSVSSSSEDVEFGAGSDKVAGDKKSTGQRLLEELRNIFNRQLFSDYRFILLLIGMAFSILGYFVPTLLITGQSKEERYNVSKGVQRNLILLWGVASLIGRLTVGRLADFGRYTRLCASLPLFLIGLLVSAACLLIFPHVMIYGNVAFVSFVLIYGFFSAPFITLRSTLFQDLYYDRKDQVASSFGWALCAEGCVIIAGFSLPTFLNSLGEVWAYVFGAGSFIISAVFLSMSLRHFFTMYEKKVADMKNAELQQQQH